MFENKDIEQVVASLKLGLDQKQGTVEEESFDVFLYGINHLDEACAITGIKMLRNDEVVENMKFMKDVLLENGFVILTMRFPDGTDFEIVTRYNDKNHTVYSFVYRI